MNWTFWRVCLWRGHEWSGDFDDPTCARCGQHALTPDEVAEAKRESFERAAFLPRPRPLREVKLRNPYDESE